MNALVLAVSPWLFYGGLAGADLATHWQAQARGCREANPMLRGPAAVDVLVKAGATVAMVKLDRKLPHGKRWSIRLTFGSITGAGVASNLVCNR